MVVVYSAELVFRHFFFGIKVDDYKVQLRYHLFSEDFIAVQDLVDASQQMCNEFQDLLAEDSHYNV